MVFGVAEEVGVVGVAPEAGVVVGEDVVELFLAGYGCVVDLGVPDLYGCVLGGWLGGAHGVSSRVLEMGSRTPLFLVGGLRSGFGWFMWVVVECLGRCRVDKGVSTYL